MLCKVISTKTVFGGKVDIQELVLANKGEPQFLYRIVGAITGYVTGESKFKKVDPETGEVTLQEWTKFAGEFVAINRKNNQFEAVICFLPDYIGGPIKAGIAHEPGNEVQIGFDIYAMFSEKSPTSYEFIAQPMRATDEPSRVEKMLENMPALPGAPKRTAISAPKSKDK